MFKELSVICILLFSIAYCGWVPQYSGTNANLNDVYFYNDSLTGYICGDSGIILKTTNSGNNWIRQTTPVTTKLNAIYFIGDTGWCVGNSGTMLMTTNGGLNWQGDSNDSLNLYDVWLFNSNEILIIGDRGNVLNTTDGGRIWQRFWVGDNTLRNMFFINNTLGWVVGDNSICAKTNDGGFNWLLESIPAIGTLRGVHFISQDTGYVIGDLGIIAKTTNGGQTWILGNINFYNYYGIDIINSDTGYICGAGGIVLKYPAKVDTINPMVDLYSINFPVSRVGWTVGTNGSIYKTSDGGAMIEEIHKKEAPSLVITPNPFTEYLIVKITDNERTAKLKICDALGKVIINKEVKDGLLILNSKNLTKGVYFIKANNTITKVIKM